MSQLTQKTSLTKDKQNKLGKAPNDIYDLEHEIAAIHSHQQHTDSQTVIKEDEEHQYKLFCTSNISTAKQSLQNGSRIKLKLPNNSKPHDLIAMAHALGFDTTKLQRLFENSSVVVKNIVDDYVSNIQSQYESLSNIKHPYQSSSNGGYLFHCTKVDALQCDTDLSAKIRISMDLDYHKNVENDNLFETKFVYELSNKVFKCSSNHIRIQDVRTGSIVVVLAGITLITLATVGLITLSVKLKNRRQRRRQNKHKEIKDKHKENQRKDKSEEKQSVEEENMIYSIFNKIKTGINSLNEQYTSVHEQEKEVRSTPNGMDDMYSQLIEMGFADALCNNAAKKYPSDINEAINWITQHEHKEEEEAHCIGDNKDKRENLILYINDSLWINRKDNLWSATVIALTRNEVTVEYDHGGPYLWKKTETFALNDECLMQREPGMDMSPSLEGCVEIKKSDDGYIKAWKTGFCRPMADL